MSRNCLGRDCLGHELRHLRRLAGARLANHDEDLVLRDGVHQLLLQRLLAVNEQLFTHSYVESTRSCLSAAIGSEARCSWIDLFLVGKPIEKPLPIDLT